MHKAFTTKHILRNISTSPNTFKNILYVAEQQEIGFIAYVTVFNSSPQRDWEILLMGDNIELSTKVLFIVFANQLWSFGRCVLILNTMLFAIGIEGSRILTIITVASTLLPNTCVLISKFKPNTL